MLMEQEPAPKPGLFLCTGTDLMIASSRAAAEAVEFQVAGDLMSAALSATVAVYDSVTGTAFHLTVDLTRAIPIRI